MAQPTTIKSGDPRNDVVPAAPKGYSKFNLSHRFMQTHRFGELSPHCSFEVVKGDITSMRLMNDTSSYSLKAPIKTDLFQKRSNFFVPLQAIIRNNWELLTAQPVSGDDVPEDADGVVNYETINAFFEGLVAAITNVSNDESVDETTYLTALIHNLLVAEMYWSQGSLLKQLYYDFSHCVRAYQVQDDDTYKIRSFDAFLEQVLSKLAPNDPSSPGFMMNFTVQFIDEDGAATDVFQVVSDSALSENPTANIPAVNQSQKINFRHFLDLARQNLNFKLTYVVTSGVDFGFDESGQIDVDYLTALFGDYFGEDSEGEYSVLLDFFAPLDKNINFDKVSAYQIVAAHFFSLDHVDYIYSAELYRQLMLYYTTHFPAIYKTFSWNGIDLQYDALSGHFIEPLCFDVNKIHSPFAEVVSFDHADAYRTALFSFRHSLRYLDYFTGGRTNPLSVGTTGDQRADVSVAVNNNAVNGVEMILAQNAARYLNFAQRAGRKISQWLDKLFPGGMPKPDMHDPQWLSTTGDALNPEQVQNTGEAQANDANSITARFKQDSNRYMFKVQPDRPGYIICLTYYDIPRAYAFATAKENMHCNRYDRFNPFMQYNGSQEVSRQEIGLAGNVPFSYQNRYEEYKQFYDVCSGGFVENLPGFAFIADVQAGLPMQLHLNPTYVRSWNTELDPFYLALTGFGLAAYFHFIVKNVNIITSNRPMEYTPQLM